MKKISLIILSLMVSFAVSAQEIDRVLVSGVITAPTGEDVEGISIYNVSSQRGTVTDSEGKFSIEVAENDRVVFTALQFQKFTVIIDKGIIDNRQMSVYINPAITQLDEIIIRPYNLTGDIRVDAGRIRHVDINSGLDLSWEAMEFDYEFQPDAQSSIRGNPAAEALGYTAQREGANFLGLVGLLSSVFKTSEGSRPRKERQIEIAEENINSLENRFINEYFTETLNIPEQNIVDFLYFVIEEEEMDPELLKENNELKLMEHLRKKSKVYLEIIRTEE